MIDGHSIAVAVKAWSQRHAHDGHILVIGGGDGTILSACTAMKASNTPLGILPLGTNNMLCRGVGFSTDYRNAARQYKNTKVKNISMAEVNGHMFLGSLAFDSAAYKIAEGREAFRAGKYMTWLKYAFSNAARFVSRSSEAFKINGKLVTGTNFMITNNPITPHPVNLSDNWKDVYASIFGRKNLNSGVMDFFSIPSSFFKKIRLCRDFYLGTWKKNRDIALQERSQFLIETTNGHATSTILIDGESRRVSFPLKVRIVPDRLHILSPA